MNATKKTQSAIDDDAELAALDRRIPELYGRDQDLLKIQIVMEASSGLADSFNRAIDSAQAEAMLYGKQFVATRDKPISPLETVLVERRVIAHALKIGNEKRQHLATKRSERIWAEHFSEIAEIEKRRVMLVLELQRTNRAREKLREKINKAGGAGYLSTDGVEFLGLGDEYAEVKWACERLITDAIATRAEIEGVKNG
jgi:hypothetical protein